MAMAIQTVMNQTYILGAVAVALVSVFTYGMVFRLVLSPIARFPGPKLAGLTFWYEFYYDVILGGRYTWKIRELHEKYGPIIRINPEELHIDDPTFYPKLYTGPSEKRDKWAWSMKMFAVARFEPEIQRLVERLCQRLKDFQETGEPVDLGLSFGALTTDVVTKYAFGKAYQCLEQPDFNPQLYMAVQANAKTTVVGKQFGWTIPLSRSLPHGMVKVLNPLMMQMVYFAEYILGEVQSVIESHGSESKSPKRTTIFQGILASDLEPSEKSLVRLLDDGISVVGAGLLTTADTLRVTAFHILYRPEVLRRLRAELTSAIPDANSCPPVKSLEQLPYLSAVVTEGYRIACGICSRLQRVSPDAPLAYRDWSIPSGTPVSMTIYLIHNRPDIFTNPEEFRPERWLENRERPAEERLDRYLVPFSKGTRACVGMNLAHAEIYLALAYIFRRFNLTLYETTRADVDIEHDFFTAFPKLSSTGVRVLVE